MSTLDIRAAAGGRLRAGQLPARVGRPVADEDRAGGGTGGVAGPRVVKVEVYDRSATARSGVDGVLLGVSSADGRPGSATVAVEVDYAGFADAFGGDWASRLRLVRLPECALSTPQLGHCRARSPLATVNDTGARTVLADVPLSAGETTVLAVEGAPSGDNGDYTATSLSPAGTWQVSRQSGDFSWAYPLRMPPAPGGPAPSLALTYSSGSVDGRIATSNNQGGWVGDGWSLWPGFIERKYASCVDDNPDHKTGDQCWATDNATLSLNGRAGELIRSGSVWRLKSDDGTRIERLSDAGRANGDNDNEYWRVTTTDGTQYFFGYHRLPGWTSGKPVTGSTWTVPVNGNNSGEPCYDATFSGAFCAQAWRWNLDYVVDPHGNSLAYFYGKEAGAYGRDNTASQRTGYDRGGWLDRIEYGMRQGQEYSQAAPLRVLFATAERCLSGCWTGAAWTSDPVDSAWTDTPWDQYCDAAPCDEQLAPTFWSARRLTKVTAQLRNGAGSYADVESWTLRQEFLNAGNGEGTPMWLRGITRTGHVSTAGGAAVSDPEITFDPGAEPLPNRVDGPSDGRTSLSRWRIKQVTNESGGKTLVTYSGPDCTRQTLPAAAHTNTQRCMPAFYAPPWGGDPTLDWFHKYVVTRVDLDDLVTDQPNQSHFYDYLDLPAWHYSDDEITKDKYRTWGDWRGYGRVQVRTGDPTQGVQTATEYRYLRGMDGDKLPSGSRDVWVSDSWGGTIEDHEALAGHMLQEITLDGAGGAEVSSTRTEPWLHGPTATRTRNGITTNAWKANTATTRIRTALAAGGFRTTKTTTAFTADGLPSTADDFGDEAVSGDETCTRYTYARNDMTWMIGKVAQTETLSGTCAAATTPAAPSTVLNRSRTFYDSYVDDSSFGVPPTRGDPVRTEELDGWSGTTPVYVRIATSGYDGNGRLTSVTDPRGFTTTIAYTTANGGLVTQTVQTNHLGHQTTTVKEPAWDLATRVTDPNGAVTDTTYDGLGRLIQVWLPGRAKATQTPSMRFAYLLQSSGGPTAITTETLLPTGGAHRKSVELFDGFLRPRQNQTQATGGGRTLTDTFHNTRGEIAWTSAAYYDSTNTAPGTSLAAPQGQIPSITEKIYDGAGRPTVEIFKANGAEKWRTTTGYGGDRTHLTPPQGATAITAITDGRGRVIEQRQYLTHADVASSDPSRYVKTTYAYTLLNQAKTVVDQLGNTWSYGYDLRGRQTSAVDPDKGITTTTYDAAGLPVTVTAPLGAGTATVAYTYDELGRKTTMRDDAVTGTIRAQWVYDTLANGKGKLTSATRYVAGNAYTNRIDAYDTFGRPTSTSLVLPAAESALCAAVTPNTCTYTTTLRYRPNGIPFQTVLPAAADLPSENLTAGVNDVGDPGTLVSAAAVYVDSVTYNKLGQLTQRVLGAFGLRVAITATVDEPTRRVTATNVVPELKPEAVNYQYGYDDAGNLTRVSDAPAGQTADHQCFRYDHLRRLTEAWTPDTDDCGAAPGYATLGGPAPYWHQWTFDATGNRLTEKRKASAGDTTYTYTHPAPATARPHTVTNVTASGAVSWTRDYTYDNAGNTKTRPTAGATQTLAFDREGKLATLTEGANATSFIYDANGNRLIRADPGGSKTLYLPDGTEVRYDAATATRKATRYYTHAGVPIAVRTATSLDWLIGDHHGTAQASITATTLTVAKRRMLPYGEQRGSSGTWPAMDKGFVGGTTDLTGLTHLGAREYDPVIGRFISVDPLMDPADPQSLHGYAYANNSPATMSDPDGLCTRLDDRDAPCVGSPNYDERQAAHEKKQSSKNKSGSGGGGGGNGPTQDEIDRANEIKKQDIISVVIRAGGQILLDLFGINDIMSCIGGDLVACAWTLIDLLPWTKAISVARKTGRIIDAVITTGRRIIAWLSDTKWADDVLRRAADACSANSFVPGTLVLMADGSTVPIEDVDVGDQVLATDPETGRTEAKTVTATITGNGDKKLVDITVDTDGDAGHGTVVSTATDRHPFWVPERREWIDAADLAAGQWLQTAAGTWTQISAITQRHQHIPVYNLTVDDIHTYYVLAGNTPVLVHNSNCDGISGWTKHGAEQADARGISEDMAENAVRTGRSTPGNRPGTTKYTGRNVWVVLNDACEVVSCGWNGRR